MQANIHSLKRQGFTLIEVMLVIVVVGIMVAAIQINFTSNKPEALLRQESVRFANVFNLAADYGLLNNIELGLYVDKSSYQFVGFDGVKWTPLPDNDMLAAYELPQLVNLTLMFDDLPIETPSLVDRALFTPDDDSLEAMKNDAIDGAAPIIPQVYLLSGGDITPFRMEFSLIDQDYQRQELSYAVVGLYDTPVNLIGPIVDGKEPSNQEGNNE